MTVIYPNLCYKKECYTGLHLRVCNKNLIFLFLKQNICFGHSKEPYTKEPSQ